MKAEMLTAWMSLTIVVGLTPAHAQSDAPPFAVLAMERLDSLLKDPAIRSRTSAKDALELFGVAPPDALGRFSDDDLKTLMGLMARSLERARPAVCAHVWREGIPKAFVPLATEMDSTLAMEWAVLVEKMVRTGLFDQPFGRRASEAQLDGVLQTWATNVSPEERTEAQQLMPREHLSDEATCRFVLRGFYRMAVLPANQGAPVLRTMMFGQAGLPRS